MPQVVIENPVINSPYEAPRHHFKFSDDGITDEIAEERGRRRCFSHNPPPAIGRVEENFAPRRGSALRPPHLGHGAQPGVRAGGRTPRASPAC